MITKTIELVPTPEIHFSVNPPCSENTGTAAQYFDKQCQLSVMPGFDHYLWNTGDSTSSITITNEGWYSVTISNEGLCYATDSVLMLYCLPLIMPNAFTPNNDGTNDLFLPAIQSGNVNYFHIIIFDRWGGPIFETEDIHEGWDGTVNGNQAPSGVYGYTLSYGFNKEESRKLSGTITLVR